MPFILKSLIEEVIIITKEVNIDLIKGIGKNISTMDISIYDESFWHSISEGILCTNKEGKIICFQKMQSPMINKNITNSKIEIGIIENGKIKLKVIGVIERFIVDGDEFDKYESEINKLFQNVFLDCISIIHPYKIISHDFIFRLDISDVESISINIDKVV